MSETSNGVRYVTVEADFEGMRIDNFLMRTLGSKVPRAFIYRILRRGEVRVNRGRIKQAYRIRAGDIVRVPPVRVPEAVAPARPSVRLAETLEASILLEDERWLVLDKPPGIAVHGGSGERTGVIEAMRALRPQYRHLELVHRLDKDTSGCLLLAVRRSALRAAHEALRERDAHKAYLAMVVGRWPQSVRRVDAPLDKNTLRSGERVVRVDAEHGKASRTAFRVVDANDAASLVEALALTGRTHQIRVHAMTAGHAIIGDPKYGQGELDARLAKVGVRRLMLHSARLRIDALGLDVAAPPGPEWAVAAAAMGLELPAAP